MNEVPPPSSDLSGRDSTRVMRIVESFDAEWQSGRQPAIDDYLRAERVQRRAVLIGLVQVDLERRLEAGETARVETYLQRYEELANDPAVVLDLLAAEYRQRRRREPDLSTEEYSRRFPALVDQLSSRLREADGPPATVITATVPVSAPVGGGAMRYRFVRFHAKGGLGEVHLAQDTELGRPVALKRIQDRFTDLDEARRRFLREAAVTARLEHPGVVPVYGLVHDAAGHPCYAMRFIEGESLDDAIRRFHDADRPGRDPGERNLALRELLGRFVTACKTIAYAHSKKVIHRDLKPANVMLGPYGETLVVDWGLAKVRDTVEPDGAATGADPPTPAGDAEVTAMGRAMGTLAYMAPEQAAGRWDLVGEASDVYGLGATLYMLLTGRHPFQGPEEEVLPRVQRGDFPLPRQGSRNVPAALEAVCLKAMALRPGDRYGTALELAADVEHWLADEPVTAFRESWPARLGRWGRRHRAAVAGAFTLLGTVAIALTVSTILIAREQVRTEDARRQEEQARLKAVAAEEQAQQKAAQAQQVSDFLVALFQIPDPSGLRGYGFRTSEEQGSSLTARTILDRGARKITAELRDQPVVQATLMDTIGDVYRMLGMHREAAPLLQQALAIRERELGPDHADVAASLHNLGWLHHDLGDYGRAEELYRKALDLRRRHLGEEHLLAATSLFNLAWLLSEKGEWDEAERMFRQVIDLRRKQLGADHRDVAIARGGLLALLLETDRYLEAAPLSADLLAAMARQEGTQSPLVVTGLAQKAIIASGLNRPREAEEALEEVLPLTHRLAGEDHPYVGVVLFELARAQEKQGKDGEAEANYRACLDVARRTVGYAHPKAYMPVKFLGKLLARKGRHEEAELLFHELVNARRQRYGRDHVVVADALYYFGDFVRDQGDRERAEALWLQALAVYRTCRAGGPHSTYPSTLNGLAHHWLNQRKYAAAEPLARESLAILRGDRYAKPAPRLNAVENMARLHRARGEYAQAVALYEESRELNRRHFPQSQEHLEQRTANLADALMDAGRYEEAAVLFEEALTAGRRRLGHRSPQVGARLRSLALARLMVGDRAGYGDACSQLVADFGGSADPGLAHGVVRTIALGGGSEDLLNQALAIMERLVRREPQSSAYLRTYAAALYRAGRYDESAKRFQELVQLLKGKGRASDALHFVLVYHALGQTERARSLFNDAVGRADRVTKPTREDPFVPARLDWVDRLELQLLRREAENMLKPPVP